MMEFSPPGARQSSKNVDRGRSMKENLPVGENASNLPSNEGMLDSEEEAKSKTKAKMAAGNLSSPVRCVEEAEADIEKLGLSDGALRVVRGAVQSLASSNSILRAAGEDSQEEARRLRGKVDALLTSERRLEAALFKAEQDASHLRGQLDSASKSHKLQAAKLAAERDAQRCLAVRLASRDDQHKAAKKKLQIDYEKLQKQLQALWQQVTLPIADCRLQIVTELSLGLLIFDDGVLRSNSKP